MGWIKSFILFLVVALGSSSCSLFSSSHTRCSAYTSNESDDDLKDDVGQSKDYKELEQVY